MNRPRLTTSITTSITTSLSVLALLFVSACGRAANGKPRSFPAVPVLTATVEQRTMPLAVRAVGHVEPIESVAIRPQVGGLLQDVHFTEGQLVQKGQVMFTIDPRPYQASQREVEARLTRDQALLRKAEADVVRYADLVKKDFVTKEQYDSMATNAESLRAIVASDQATLDNARLQLAYCTIAAPLSGRTGNLMVKAGNLVKANDDKPLVTINQVPGVFVSFAVPAEYLRSVRGKVGDGLKINAYLPGEDGAESGSLVLIDNAVDATTSTILLKGRFANPDERLWPGQFVDTELVLEQQANRLVVPAAAVLTGQQGTYVWVVKDGTADFRLVKVARLDERDAVIESGLGAGETVVTDGQLRLAPGAKVEVRSDLGQAPGARS
jgi:membrane fusion protein, multidrug efflux system